MGGFRMSLLLLFGFQLCPTLSRRHVLGKMLHLLLVENVQTSGDELGIYAEQHVSRKTIPV